MRILQRSTILALVLFASPALAQPTIEQIIKKAEAKFEPAEAKPGQTVTLRINVQLLEGWHTYPTVQPDKAAAAQSNRLTLPEPGAVIYVGELDQPPQPKEKAEPLASIERVLFYPGGGVWEHKAVVAPTANPGKTTSKIKFRVLVCDKDNCLPPKALDLEATLKVAGDPVEVDPKYKKEVEKAAKK